MTASDQTSHPNASRLTSIATISSCYTMPALSCRNDAVSWPSSLQSRVRMKDAPAKKKGGMPFGAARWRGTTRARRSVTRCAALPASGRPSRLSRFGARLARTIVLLRGLPREKRGGRSWTSCLGSRGQRHKRGGSVVLYNRFVALQLHVLGTDGLISPDMCGVDRYPTELPSVYVMLCLARLVSAGSPAC